MKSERGIDSGEDEQGKKRKWKRGYRRQKKQW